MIDLNRDNISYAVTQNFLTILKNNVISVDTPNPAGGNTTHTIIKWATNYNDKQLSDKSNYPMLLVEKASAPDDFLTFRQKNADGSIEVQIHCTNSIATSKFYDLIKETIENNENEFRDVGIRSVWLDHDSSDTYVRNGFKDHWALLVFKFEYEFNYGD